MQLTVLRPNEALCARFTFQLPRTVALREQTKIGALKWRFFQVKAATHEQYFYFASDIR